MTRDQAATKLEQAKAALREIRREAQAGVAIRALEDIAEEAASRAEALRGDHPGADE